MTEKTRVELDIITYSLVGARRSDSEFRVHCFHAKDLESAIRRRLTAYALRCIQARDVQDVVFKGEAGQFLKGKLARLLKLPIGDGDAERCDITQELTAALSDRMTASGAGTAPGALLAIQARIDGNPCIALVKVDLGHREIIALQRADSRLFSKVFEDVLPEHSKVRKALLAPSPGEGDARSCQFDAVSDYWQEFVGAQPLRETVKATQAILRTAREVAQQEGIVLTETLIRNILDNVAALKPRTPSSVARVIKDITRVQKKLDKIEQALLRHLGQATLDGVTKVSAYRYRFLKNTLKLLVPAHLFHDGKFAIRIDGDEIVIRIRDTNIDRDDIVDNRP